LDGVRPTKKKELALYIIHQGITGGTCGHITSTIPRVKGNKYGRGGIETAPRNSWCERKQTPVSKGNATFQQNGGSAEKSESTPKVHYPGQTSHAKRKEENGAKRFLSEQRKRTGGQSFKEDKEAIVRKLWNERRSLPNQWEGNVRSGAEIK